MGEIFKKENLCASLYTDLLKAFEQDAKETPIDVWEQLIYYCKYSACPVGRFILALYDEPTSAYIPAETLCAVLQISNHLQDIKKDAIELNRCYLPKEILDKYGASSSDVYLSYTFEPLKLAILETNNKLKQMLNDTKLLCGVVKSWRLKVQIGIIISLTNSMLKKIDKNDILTTNIKLNKFDFVKALVCGSFCGLLSKIKYTGRTI